MTWVTDRIAVGGGIWNEANMRDVASQGVTHIINMQVEFDDRELARPHRLQVLWNAIEDDFQHKPAEIFERGVGFGLAALQHPGSRIYIHCAAGVHRAPMMALALLCALGWKLEEAKKHIQSLRYVVDWAEIYVRSVEDFLRSWAPAAP